MVSKFAVILAAAGASSRFGDPFQKKVFAQISGKPLWMYAAELFSGRSDVGQLILVIAEDDRELFNEKYSAHAALLGIQTVVGGANRAASVLNGLKAVQPEFRWVAVHDAARPCLSRSSVDAVFAAARESGAAILACPCHSTLKRVNNQKQIVETLPRGGLWLAQTPQCFETQLLLESYKKHPDPGSATDEASLVESLGHSVRIVEDSPLNIKVTTKSDLKFAEVALKSLPQAKAFPF